MIIWKAEFYEAKPAIFDESAPLSPRGKELSVRSTPLSPCGIGAGGEGNTSSRASS